MKSVHGAGGHDKSNYDKTIAGTPEDEGMQARIQSMAIPSMAALALAVFACLCLGGEPQAQSAGDNECPISLGRPEPVRQATFNVLASVPDESAPISAPAMGRFVVRAQSPDVPPPPPPPPPPGSGPVTAPLTTGINPAEEGFNCGVANTPKAGGGFWTKFCDGFNDCCGNIFGSVKTVGSRTLFESDHKFDVFASPVSNPFYFEDPRALTEIRPIFIWQRTPSANPIYGGASNFFVGARGSVAVTDWLSFTFDELGWDFTNVNNPQGDFHSGNGLSELHLGPKITFIRNDVSNTVAAAGLIVEVPWGGNSVFQNTHNLGLTPYFSIAQNFWRTDFGSFNFMNTDGVSLGLGAPRGDMLYSSLHLDYDVGNFKKIYPLIELNYAHYFDDGNREPINFEGRDLFHFGSSAVGGLNELTIAAGLRYKVSEHLQFGLVGETSVLGHSSRHMDAFRLTFDVIFRY
jgi:hypothetical protein